MSTLAPRFLGRTGLAVYPLGFGGAPIGNLYAPVDAFDAIGAVRAALNGGTTLFDTAPSYGRGLSERRLGLALADSDRDRIVVSTKVGKLLRPGPGPSDAFVSATPHHIVRDLSADGTQRSLEHSLLRLGLDRIDVALIHDVDVPGADFDAARAGALRALEEMRRAGAIRAVGVGVNSAEAAVMWLEAADLDVVLCAGSYSLLDREAERRFLPLAQARGTGVILGGVLATGILASGGDGTRYRYEVAGEAVRARVFRMEAACAAANTTLLAAALQFPFRHPAVSAVVIGARTPREWQANAAAFASPISDGVWSALEAACLVP